MPKKNNKRRSDGRIAVQVYLGTFDGKRKYKTVYGDTQKEADKKAQEIRTQIALGINVAESNKSFTYWSDKFLAYKDGKVGQGWYTCLSRRIKHFQNELGNADVTKIMLCDIQDIIDKYAKNNPYTKKPSSKKTLLGYVSVITQCFDYFVANRLISYNPLTLLSVSKEAPQEKRKALSCEQVEWILNTEHRAKIGVMIMLYCGLRRGELTALTWNDINLTDNTISITKSYDNTTQKIKSTKTDNGLRVVPIPQILSDYLSEQDKSTILVFPNKTSGYMSSTSWKIVWKSYMRTLNLKYGNFLKPPKINRSVPIVIQTFTPHQLRHTYATLLYDAGVDVVTAKYLMGHSDIKTTLQIYTDLSKENEKKNIDKLNSYLNNSDDASQNASQTTDNA